MDQGLRQAVFSKIAGIIKEAGDIPLIINGMPDHVHILVKMRSDNRLADLVRVVKSRTSRWIHETWPDRSCFQWQTGYGAFTVSFTHVEKVREYIANQEEHHKENTIDQEILRLYRRNGIQIDEATMWD
jgi:REP element-mobilizing transposase RayT